MRKPFFYNFFTVGLYHPNHTVQNLADILEELWLSNALPVLVIHTFVAFEVALPSAIWTCTGSSGSFSFDQKYTIYGPILKICGTQNSSLLWKLHNQVCIFPNQFLEITHFHIWITIYILPLVIWQIAYRIVKSIFFIGCFYINLTLPSAAFQNG